ncbi:hypothetical protein [uncultured Nostoc sp.]
MNLLNWVDHKAIATRKLSQFLTATAMLWQRVVLVLPVYLLKNLRQR